MSKLDNKRKAVILLIGITLVICMITGRPKPAETQGMPVPAVPAPVVEATLTPPSPAAEAVVPDDKPMVKFIIYRDNIVNNHYVLSGFMPAGKCIKVNDSWKENCQEGKKCLKIDYDSVCSAEDQGWAGAYWLEPANNWGDKKGGYNLTGVTKLVFWARGDKGGEIINSFKMGGITGAQHVYPDTDSASLGPVTLTNEWQQYTIDLKDKDLTYIVGGFSWAANAQANPAPITFYLDDIHFE